MQYPATMEPPSLVLPIVYDISSNITQLAERRDSGPAPAMTAANQLLRHFAQFQPSHTECSLFPAVRELLMNLVLPSEPQQNAPAAAVVQQIQPPVMQMRNSGQPGWTGMPMRMMGPTS